MTQSIHVDSASLNRPRSVKLRGAVVDVAPSPYDIPIRINAQVTVDLFEKSVVITIEYLGGTEPLTSFGLAEPVRLQIGRKTQRLYVIRVEIDRLGGLSRGIATRCTEASVEAISRLKEQNTAPHRIVNYDVIMQLIKQFGPTIFGPLEANK